MLKKNRFGKHIKFNLRFILFVSTFTILFIPSKTVNAQEQSEPIINIDFDLDEIIDSLTEITDSILNLPSTIAKTLIETIIQGMQESLTNVNESFDILNFDGISGLISSSLEFIKSLTFIIAELTFIIGIGLFTAPSSVVSSELAARGKRMAFNSIFIAILTNFQIMIITFFRTLSTSLTDSIKTVQFPSLTKALTNVFINVGLNMFILSSLIFVASIIVLVFLSCTFLLEALSPIIFSLALLIYSLPFGEEVANRLAVSSLVYFFLKPIIWSIIILDIYILTTVVSILTPFIICVFDLIILWLLFQVSSSMGVQYPILDQLNSAFERGISLGIAYVVASYGGVLGGYKN
jgi:hypothetical protein